jgi:hypothetical protein
METSTPRGPHLCKQVRHDDKGLMTVTIPKYNPMNNCSEGAPVCSKVVIVTDVDKLKFIKFYARSNE